MRSLGIDVGVRKGLDVVLLDGAREPAETHRRVTLERLPALIADCGPDVVAIDAPPSWAIRGGSRQTERELRLFGIQSYGTPTEDRGSTHSFYEWMRVGFEVFDAAARSGFPRFGGGRVQGHALEVFPHASAVVLAGCRPPAGLPRARWRASVLEGRAVSATGLRSADQVDAALAALTGLLALGGQCTALGDPREGVIVLPVRSLPPGPYPRCRQTARTEEQPRLPRTSTCRCGDPTCDRLTAREFAPGHDAKRKAILWQLAREGEDALDELRRRGWKLPPEVRGGTR